MVEEKRKGMFKTKLVDRKWTAKCQLDPTPLIFLAIAIFDTLLSELETFEIKYCIFLICRNAALPDDVFTIAPQSHTEQSTTNILTK
jgi:hypothetical protein